MTHLILTTSDSGGGYLKATGIADIVIPLGHRFAAGRLPSDTDLAGSLAALDDHPGVDAAAGLSVGLIDLCRRSETVELWIDPDPNAQLVLVWFLDDLRSQGMDASKLVLRQADVVIGDQGRGDLSSWSPPPVRIADNHLNAANIAWQAYRQPTPQPWFDLLGEEIDALPQLRQAVLEMLEELPGAATGLGATEMQILALLSEGLSGPFDVFPGDNKRNQRRVFGYWEVGSLLDALARCPAPAVTGLKEGPFTDAMHDDRARLERYKQSKLQLTALGEAVLAGRDDFSRHNPIHRWWGGTELTSDRLWRWDAANRALIAP